MHAKNSFPMRGAIGGAAFVTVIWFLCWLKILPFDANEQMALFTGLGFVGVVAAFLHERQQAAEGDKAHDELIDAMLRQAEAAMFAARVSAATVKLTRLEEMRDWSNRTGLAPADWEGDRNTYMLHLHEQMNALHILMENVITEPKEKLRRGT